MSYTVWLDSCNNQDIVLAICFSEIRLIPEKNTYIGMILDEKRLHVRIIFSTFLAFVRIFCWILSQIFFHFFLFFFLLFFHCFFFQIFSQIFFQFFFSNFSPIFFQNFFQHFPSSDFSENPRVLNQVSSSRITKKIRLKIEVFSKYSKELPPCWKRSFQEKSCNPLWNLFPSFTCQA